MDSSFEILTWGQNPAIQGKIMALMAGAAMDKRKGVQEGTPLT